jgi:hypothetical protein
LQRKMVYHTIPKRDLIRLSEDSTSGIHRASSLLQPTS